MNPEPIVSVWSRYHDAIMIRLCELYLVCFGGGWWPL
jgi:hypothetical protein